MNELIKAIKDLCAEKGIDENVILDALEAALVAAYKKNYYKGKNDAPNVLVSIDRKTGEIHVYAQKTVVELVEDERDQISLDDARAISGEYEIGDITAVDMKLSSDISFVYDDRIEVSLGGYTDIDYKLALAKKILFEQLTEEDEGVLNLSVPELPGFKAGK